MINEDKEKKDTFSKIMKSYIVDAEGLGAIGETGMLAEAIPDFINYRDFLKHNNKATNTEKLIKKLSDGTGIIDATNKSPKLKRVFYYAHLAACCELFCGWELPLQSINRVDMQQHVQQSLSSFTDSFSSHDADLIKRVHVSDAVRSIHVLRMLGLLKLSSSSSRQLSFAAGAGDRDLDGVHMTPAISTQGNLLSKTASSIIINRYVDSPENLILVDNDPDFESRYKRLSETNPAWMLALNEDADNAMKKLPMMMQKRNWNPVNLVVGIRIDHRMIPDIRLFFSQLKPLLDDRADLIFTIGAGHSLDEFRGRKKLMQAMFDFFKQRGMAPVKIIMHSGETLEEQRLCPSFGVSNFTSYEILYCRLLNKKL